MLERPEPVYLDYNATTPHAPEAIAAMRPYLERHFGNPSSSHVYGVRAREAVERARRQVADLLACQPGEIVFTSGGTESNNFAIRGAALALQYRGRHVVTSQVEHPAVTAVCERLRREGFEITCVPVDRHGLVDAGEVERALRPDTILITLMHANNEVGAIQPVEAVGRLAAARGILFHTDAAQSVGKIPVRVGELGVDLLSIAGHKLYAPKGVGALYIRTGVKLERLMDGAGQERGLRPGTENVLEIAGLGAACETAARHLAEHARRMRAARDLLEERLRASVPDMRVNGHPEKRLPNTSSVSMLGVDANELLTEIGGEVAASAGSACHSGQLRISRVLEAMGVPEEWARGTIRLSTGRTTGDSEIERAASAISVAAKRLRAKCGAA